MNAPTRRLAAVWFADIVGYSTLSSRDETSALELVRAFQPVAQDAIEAHQGRLVRFIGDAAFAEFASTDGAVRAALDLRRTLAEAWEAAGQAGQIRVGVHVGDVALAEDGDLHGEGINVAARLCEEAGPGQILASQDVWRQLRQLKDLHFAPAGERRLKGIAVPVYAFSIDPADASDEAEVLMQEPPLRRRIAAASRAAALLALAGAVILLTASLFRDAFDLGRWVTWSAAGVLAVGFAFTLRTAWLQSAPTWERPAGGPAPWDLDLAELMKAVTHLRAPKLNWARLMVGGAMAFAALFGAAGLWIWSRDNGIPFPGPTEAGATPDLALAVLPFDSTTGIWADGLPELLALSLDGVSGIRVIDPRVVRGRAAGQAADSTSAIRIGEALGARYAAIGTFETRDGRGTLTIDVFDVRTGRLRQRAEATGVDDAIPLLVEQVAAQVLAEALPDTQAHPWQIDAAVTGSVPALMAYLRGMRELRRGNWPGALTEFDQAVTADADFALARYRRAFVRVWSMPPHILFQDPEARLAAEQAGGLPERERLMVEGYYQTHFRLPEAIPTLRRLTSLYPDDPEGWFLLGDALYHLAPDSAGGDFEEALRTVIELAPDFGPAYPHLVEAALEQGDSARVGQLVAEYREAEPLSPLLPGLSWAVRITRRYVPEPEEPADVPGTSDDEPLFRAAARAAERARTALAGRAHPALGSQLRTVDSLGTRAAEAAEAGRFREATELLDQARREAESLARDSESLRELDSLQNVVAALDSVGTEGPLGQRARALIAAAGQDRDRGSYDDALDAMRRADEILRIAAEADRQPEQSEPIETTAAPETPVAPAVEPETVVQETLAALREAIESESLDRVRAVWTGISAEQAESFRGLFDSVRDLAVTFTVRSVHTRGSRYVAEVDTRYEFYALANRRLQRTEASQMFEIEEREGRWIIVSSSP